MAARFWSGLPMRGGTGAVYQFVRDDKGTASPADHTWSQTLQWRARDAAAGDKFGWAVARWDVQRRGRFARRRWRDQRRGGLRIPLADERLDRSRQARRADAASLDRFGDSLDLEGNRILVGATDGDTGVLNSGSAYLFEIDDQGTTDPFDDVWDMVAEVAASHAGTDNAFGTSLGLSGDTLIVGDPLHDDRGVDSGTCRCSSWVTWPRRISRRSLFPLAREACPTHGR